MVKKERKSDDQYNNIKYIIEQSLFSIYMLLDFIIQKEPYNYYCLKLKFIMVNGSIK